MEPSDIVIAPCGCPYSKKTWKDDSVCWFCPQVVTGGALYNKRHIWSRGLVYDDETDLLYTKTIKGTLVSIKSRQRKVIQKDRRTFLLAS